MATTTGGTASQSSAHKGFLDKGRNSVDRYKRLTQSGAHTMISNLGEVRKSAESENMPDKDIKFDTEFASMRGERSGDDKLAHYGVICEGIKSALPFESSTCKVVLDTGEMSADRDHRLTQKNANKVISGKGIYRDKAPTFASPFSLSSMQKRSGEMEEPSQSQGDIANAATESYHHGMLQRLTVVIHKAERDSPSLVGAAGGDSTETSTKGSMFNYLAGIHDITSTSSIGLNLSFGEEDEVPEATSSVHQMAVVRDQLESDKQKSMQIGNSLVASADDKKTTTPDCNKGLAKVKNDEQRKVGNKNFARMKKNTVCAEKGAKKNSMLASSIDVDLSKKDGEFMPPAVSVLRKRVFLAETEDKDPTALTLQVRDNNIVGMERDLKTITDIASSESFFKENSWKSDSVIRNVPSRTENAEEINMSNMAEAKEDAETRNEQAWESVLSGRKE
jgi:hypothetical protein